MSACVLGVGIGHAMGKGVPDADVLDLPASVRAKIGGAVFASGALLWLVPWQR